MFTAEFSELTINKKKKTTSKVSRKKKAATNVSIFFLFSRKIIQYNNDYLNAYTLAAKRMQHG